MYAFPSLKTLFGAYRAAPSRGRDFCLCPAVPPLSPSNRRLRRVLHSTPLVLAGSLARYAVNGTGGADRYLQASRLRAIHLRRLGLSHLIFGVGGALRTPNHIFPSINIPVISVVFSYKGPCRRMTWLAACPPTYDAG